MTFFNCPACIRRVIAAALAMCVIHFPLLSQDDSDVILKKWIRYSDSPNSLYHHLADEAFAQIRNNKVAPPGNIGELKKWQKARQKQIWKQLGGEFKEKTPLNAKITGIVQKDGYRLENLIYESLPGFFVTATMFIPDSLKRPAPAILFCSGHSTQAYRRDIYQVPLLNLVKKGFIVLAFDPVGQGERLQYFSEKEGKSVVGGSTHEHSYPAVQSFLIGESVARYFVWDGIRGIDYLVGRKEVDSSRIGVHGLSGGGTQTAYIAALDNRVAAAAPAGYITGFKRLLESVGVQDGEQNFFHGLKAGIDHDVFLEIRAPKPTLIMATTRDFFSIQGAREMFEKVKKVYGIFGSTSNLEITEGDYEHGYTRNIREAMYAFFQKHLSNPGDPQEENLKLLSEEELRKTTTGQIASSMKGKTIFELNSNNASKWLTALVKNREEMAGFGPYVIEQSKKASGFRSPKHKEEIVFTGRTVNDGFVAEKYYIRGEGDYPVPYLMFKPEKPTKRMVLYLNPAGKSESVKEREVEWLIGKGITVVMPDVIGTGELKPDVRGDAAIGGESYNLWFMGALTGRSILAIQAADLIRVVTAVRSQNPGYETYALAKEGLCPLLLHTAAWDSSISRIALVRPYSSYESVVRSQFYQPRFVSGMVPGALRYYDLPDLAATLAPRKLSVLDMTDANGVLLNPETAKLAYAPAIRTYAGTNQNFLLRNGVPLESFFDDWLK